MRCFSLCMTMAMMMMTIELIQQIGDFVSFSQVQSFVDCLTKIYKGDTSVSNTMCTPSRRNNSIGNLSDKKRIGLGFSSLSHYFLLLVKAGESIQTRKF